MGQGDVISTFCVVFCGAVAILVVGSIQLANNQTYLHRQNESLEVLTYMNVSHHLCSQKVCEMTEMPREQMSPKCNDVTSNLGLYQPGETLTCNDGFLCLEYQTVDWTTCYNLLLVNTSQINCYNTYNCKSISKTQDGVNYELECETYGLLNQLNDCKCSYSQPSVCQMPINQFSYNCNGPKRCTQPIHDRKCQIQVSECYTIKAERGFMAFDGTQVTTSDQIIECQSPNDPSCPQLNINALKLDLRIWYQSTDFSDWRYDPYNPNEASNITMICFGGVFILIVISFCCIGCYIHSKHDWEARQPKPTLIPVPTPAPAPAPAPVPVPYQSHCQPSSNEKVHRSHANSIELAENSIESSEVSIQLSKHSSSQSQLSFEI